MEVTFRAFLILPFPFILCESPDAEKRFGASRIVSWMIRRIRTIGLFGRVVRSKGGVFLWLLAWITHCPALAG
jgi:hypothetical protein